MEPKDHKIHNIKIIFHEYDNIRKGCFNCKYFLTETTIMCCICCDMDKWEYRYNT